MKKRTIILLALVALLVGYRYYRSTSRETYAEFTWPTSEIAELLPVPKSNVGEIQWETEDHFVIHVAKTSSDDFNSYVAECKNNGFTVDYISHDGYYSADNEDGASLNLRYEDNVMTITLYGPEGEDTVDATTEVVEEETTEATEEEIIKDETTEEETDPDNSSDTDIRQEFKEAMDSYEAFIDEYCEFMKKYNESGNSTSMVSDYLSYMTKYADVMLKLSELENDELSNAELAYYIEVYARISQKLLEVAQ